MPNYFEVVKNVYARTIPFIFLEIFDKKGRANDTLNMNTTPKLDYELLTRKKHSALDKAFKALRIAIMDAEIIQELVQSGYQVRTQPGGWYVRFRELP